MFRHLRIQSPERSPRALPAALIALAASGCGRQFDLGEITRLLEQNGGESAAAQPLGGTVLLSSVDDIDVLVSDATVWPPEPTPDTLPTALGDVDGDGFGDWIQGDTLFYGAPRPEGERLELRDRTRFRFELAGNGTFRPAGDVNGDGLMDILFGSDQLRWVASYDPVSHELEPARQFPVSEPAGRLVLGSRERLGAEVELASVGLAFGDRDALLERFAELLASDLPDSFVQQDTVLEALGDLNADGFADFASTTTVSYHRYLTDANGSIGGGGEEVRRESVSYVHHGHADPLEIAEPRARLDADVRWSAAGDIDGDGLPDVIWTSPQAFYLLPGSVAAAGGELGLARAIEVAGLAPRFYFDTVDTSTGALGDLDGDGFDDFAVNGAAVVSSPTDVSTPWWLFYGGPELLEGPVSAALASAQFETQLSSSVQPLGDWDGDGRPDLLLTRSLWLESDEPGRMPGGREAVLLRGGAERFSGRHVVSQQRPELGAAVTLRQLVPAPAGDLDGDGFTDLFIKGLTGAFDLGITYGAPLPLPIVR